MAEIPAHSPLLLAEITGTDGPFGVFELPPETAVWPYFAYGVLGLFLICGLIWLALYLRRQRRPLAPPAEFTAKRRLDRIDRDRDELAPNKLALAVSDVLKDFLAERFSDPVRFETTEEFLLRSSTDGSALPEVVRRNLGEFLAHADEVKFANRPDAAVSAHTLLGLAREILSLCRTVGNDGK